MRFTTETRDWSESVAGIEFYGQIKQKRRGSEDPDYENQICQSHGALPEPSEIRTAQLLPVPHGRLLAYGLLRRLVHAPGMPVRWLQKP